MTSEPPLFMDFEASSLCPDCYAIQVAWSNADGSVTECWYIEPDSAHGRALEEGWDPAAERVHGIPFATLREQGKPAAWRHMHAAGGRRHHANTTRYPVEHYRIAPGCAARPRK